jgi:hypothetical protein
LYRGKVILGIAAWLAVVVGGGAVLLQHDRDVKWVPALSFAGVDVVYALRRVAAEAEVLLLLDEMSPREELGDLFFYDIDTDLATGPLSDMLDELRRHSDEGWEYEIDDGVLYVRSSSSLDGRSVLDQGYLRPGQLEVDFLELVAWIMAQRTEAFLTVVPGRGQPVYKKVVLDVPEQASPVDVLKQYARKVGAGWRLTRAGRPEPGEQITSNEVRIVSSVVSLWLPLSDPVVLPSDRLDRSPITALARIDLRVPEPICAFDRTLFGMNRGALDLDLIVDPGEELEQSLELIGRYPDGRQRFFLWEWNDGVVLAFGRNFLATDTRMSLLNEKVRGGHFSGSLGQLVRWLNANRLDPSIRRLYAGEIDPNARTATLEIKEGTLVFDVLLDFARATGVGWNYVLRDAGITFQARDLPGFATIGAYVTSMDEWAKAPNLQLN